MPRSLVGRRFPDSRLVVTREAIEDGKRVCYCDCDCGTKDFRVSRWSFVSGNTRSCSCLALDGLRKRMSKFGDPDLTRSQILGWRSQGFSCRQIGAKVGLSGGRVQQVLAEHRESDLNDLKC